MRWPTCSRRMHLQHGGKLSLARLLAGHLDDGATLQSSSGESGPRLRHPRRQRRARHQARRRPRPATPSRSASSMRSRPATRCRAARPRRRRWRGSSRRRRCWRSSLAANDRKDDVKLGQALHAAERGRSVADDRCTTRRPTTSCCGGRARCICASRCERLHGPLRRQRQIASARDRLSGDHPQIGHPARPAQEAVRRPRPVRRRGAGDQADAARRGLRVPRKGRRRRGAAQLYRRGGGGRGRRAGARPARLPRDRRRR